MRWVDMKFMTNENHTFYHTRCSSLGHFDAIISFLRFSHWFLENESILVDILVANPCASSLKSPFLDPPHIKSWISSKPGSISSCWNILEDVISMVHLNYMRRLLTSINHSLNNLLTLTPTITNVLPLLIKMEFFFEQSNLEEEITLAPREVMQIKRLSFYHVK
jgi:hypothetical protein